eukprot:203542_1
MNDYPDEKLHDEEEIALCRIECEKLRKSIEKLRCGDENKNHFSKTLADRNDPRGKPLHVRPKRTLRGHFSKVYDVAWGPDSHSLVSASQDGKLIVWDGPSTNKICSISLKSLWVLACDYGPDDKFVASAGLDDMCTIHPIIPEGQKSRSGVEECFTLQEHDGYISSVKFVNEHELITSSGDTTCILWDLESRRPIATFQDHVQDVTDVDSCGQNLVATASCDATARIWDSRQSGRPAVDFVGHEADLNSVRWFPDENAIVTGSDDSTCRFFDIRSRCQMNMYTMDDITSGVTSLDFSQSGNYIFAGYDDNTLFVWNTLTGKVEQQIQGHTNRISSVCVSGDGRAVCTGSWDTFVRIFS